MKKYTVIITQFLLIAFLINTTVAMEQNNKFELLFSLPAELLRSALFTPPSLKQNVKTGLQLRKTCKQINTSLSAEIIGKNLSHYDQADKDNTLGQLLKHLNEKTYRQYKNAAMILIHSGANDNKNELHFYPTLLERAASCNDIDTVKTLFNNGAKPDQRNLFCPVFFIIKNSAVAQEFINRGFDIHTTNWGMVNVLWYTMIHNHPSSLIQFYLNLGVNVKELDPESGSCIAHYFADLTCQSFDITSEPVFDNYIKNCKLLLDAAPDMLNLQDKRKTTPRDQANKYLAHEKDDTRKEFIQKIIDLFEEYQK